MKNSYLSLFLLFGVNFIATSCYYPKVEITSTEYNLIAYKRKQKLIFENNNKTQDTVLIFLNYPKGFESNFDFWLNRKLLKSDTISEKRRFGKQFATDSNYEKNKYKKANLNLSISLYYTKKENDKGLVLYTDIFEERYNLNNYSLNDTLVFKEKDNLSPCTSEHCIRKIKYLNTIGIVYLEKENGEIWKLKK